MTAFVQISVAAFLLCSVFLHALQQKIWWIVVASAVAVSVHEITVRDERGPAPAQAPGQGSP